MARNSEGLYETGQVLSDEGHIYVVIESKRLSTGSYILHTVYNTHENIVETFSDMYIRNFFKEVK